MASVKRVRIRKSGEGYKVSVEANAARGRSYTVATSKATSREGLEAAISNALKKGKQPKFKLEPDVRE